jgi:signal transduction histidine kinase/ActR/RegA family two-component response regulator
MSLLPRKWQSFDSKLPLLASGLVLITALTLVVTAYYQLERALLASAEQRLASTAEITAQLLMRPGLRRESGHVPEYDPLVRFLRGAGSRQEAMAVLREPQAPGENKAYAALLDAAGRVLLEYRRDTLPAPSWPATVIASRAIRGDSALVSPLEPYGTGAGYSRIRRLRGAGDTATLGYVVAAYPLTSATVQEFKDIVGGGVELRVGNPAAGVWTDLERIVSPPVSIPSGHTAVTHSDHIVAAARMPGTGLLVWLSQSTLSVVTPVRSLLWNVIPLGLGIAALGALLMWRMARNITHPLAQLTEVAEGVARDSHSMPRTDEMPADVKNADEITRLRFAFERMSDRVAERQALEAQLRHAQKMEAIGRLAGGVAHDFNNLLTAIRSYADLLLEDMPPYDPKRGDVLEIRKAAERAASLTAQLLAFGRKTLLQPRVLDTREVLTDIQAMLRRLMIEDIRLEVSAPDGLWPVKADRGQLEQVIVNLAVNARDAMPAGGLLRITGMNVVVQEAMDTRHGVVPAGDYVAIRVSDTGAGMDTTTQNRVFEPFFTTKSVGQGTGLGLATVHGIVAQSGGIITVDSEPMRGSTFTVYLPRATEAPGEKAAAGAVVNARANNETILLVEDETAVRALARRVLVRAGFRVLEASSPSEALALAERHALEISMVLTDVVMPELSGPALVEKLRRTCPGVRVLFISGYTDDEVISRGLGHAEMDLLQKPFSAQQLVERIRNVLDRRSGAS